MPDLLLELFSEEIPARMQARAADDLKRLVTERLVDAGLVYEGAKAFVTPRRLALWVQGVPVRQPDVREERRGPRVGAPENAVQGFLKSAGLASLDLAKVQKDPKKGDFYIALIERPGRPAIEVLAEILPAVVRGFPWPKSMRWGKPSERPGALTWVRPLHSIVATFGPETEEPDVVAFSVDGIAAGDTTRGHRFLAPEPFRVRRLEDYAARLQQAKVVLDPERRAAEILADARNLAFAQGYALVEDAELLAEVAGLVEWPVVLMGAFDEAFLAIPPEVIRTTIRNNQKCFVLRRGGASFGAPPAAAPQDGEKGSTSAPTNSPHPEQRASARVSKDGQALANRFILVANTEAADGGKAIVAGNERVIRARLSDAKFFYETDLKVPLEARLPKLKEIVFHEKLGTQAERVERIERLARELARVAGADPEQAARGARLAKADLVTEMVGEFPELQGLMGKYYALAQGEDAAVAAAIEEHYRPLGPADRVPTSPVSIAVALADKLDTLVGFWAIDEKPTGSKDPYALRRAALGVIRLILDNELRLHLMAVYKPSLKEMMMTILPREFSNFDQRADEFAKRDSVAGNSLLTFFADRLKVQLREQGARHDLVDAVFALGASSTSPWRGEVAGRRPAGGGESSDHPTPARASALADPPPAGEGKSRASAAAEMQDDLVLIVRRVEALAKFLASDDGKNLLAGYKRAVNIIRIEEKKDGRAYHGKPDPSLYLQKEERELAVSIHAAKQEAEAAVAREDFAAAMHAIATLRPFVDAFFDKVTVNVEMSDRRENRLKLLNEIREATRAVADFSKIEG